MYDCHVSQKVNIVHQYTYVVDDPVNKADPMGLRADGDGWYGDQELWDQSAPSPQATPAQRMVGGVLLGGPALISVVIVAPMAISAVLTHPVIANEVATGFVSGVLSGYSEGQEKTGLPSLSVAQTIGAAAGTVVGLTARSVVDAFDSKVEETRVFKLRVEVDMRGVDWCASGHPKKRL